VKVLDTIGDFMRCTFSTSPNSRLKVIMVVTEDEANGLFEKLKVEKIKVYYSKTPVEFGTTDEGH
jgi:hypothetical protein